MCVQHGPTPSPNKLKTTCAHSGPQLSCQDVATQPHPTYQRPSYASA